MTIALEDALLSGLPIGAGQRANCTWCNADLRPNDRVEAHVYLIDDDVRLGGVRCEACARGELSTPTLGATEWVARGTLAGTIDAAGRSQLVLSGATVVDKSGPSEGSEP